MDAIDRTITGLRATRQILDHAIAGWSRRPDGAAAVALDAAFADAITSLDRAFADWSTREEDSADVIDLAQWRRRRSA